jgi:hypothetical protein
MESALRARGVGNLDNDYSSLFLDVLVYNKIKLF